MRRLTEIDFQGNWSLKGVQWQQLYVGQIITEEVRERIYGALCKLLEHEEISGSGKNKRRNCTAVWNK